MPLESASRFAGITVNPEGVRIATLAFGEGGVVLATAFYSPDYHANLRQRFASFSDCGHEVAGYLADCFVGVIVQSLSDLAACIKIGVLNLHSVVLLETTDKIARRWATKKTTVTNFQLLSRLNAEFGLTFEDDAFAVPIAAAWFAAAYDSAIGVNCDDQQEIIFAAREREAEELE